MALFNKSILILGAGLEQAIAIREAKKLGLIVIACDQNKHASGFEYADISLVLDINKVDAIEKVAREHNVNGVFAHAVEIPDVVAEVAFRLGLPGLPPDIARRATNKIFN